MFLLQNFFYYNSTETEYSVFPFFTQYIKTFPKSGLITDSIKLPLIYLSSIVFTSLQIITLNIFQSDMLE